MMTSAGGDIRAVLLKGKRLAKVSLWAAHFSEQLAWASASG
jgi:hypothetical protein